MDRAIFLVQLIGLLGFNQAFPHCGKPCTKDYRPVCGSDKVEYSNRCMFEIAQCENPQLTEESDPSVCDVNAPNVQAPGCEKPCTREYKSVCGSDKVQYSNRCMFEIAQCKDPQLTEESDPSVCGVANVKTLQVLNSPNVQTAVCVKPCPDVNSPVCGSDQKVYENTCFLRNVQCTKRKLRIMPSSFCECSTDYEPRCGTDNIQYNTECEMKLMVEQSNGNVVEDYMGECEKCQKVCPTIYNPMCGTDGNTYSNECVLDYEGCESNGAVVLKHRGECKLQLSGKITLPPTDSTPLLSDGSCLSIKIERKLNANQFQELDTFNLPDVQLNPDLRTISYEVEFKLYPTSYHYVEAVITKGGCAKDKLNGAIDYKTSGLLYFVGGFEERKQFDFEMSSKRRVKRSLRGNCDKQCFLPRSPVCGTDWKTYSNTCYMQIAACKTGTNINVMYNKECDYDYHRVRGKVTLPRNTPKRLPANSCLVFVVRRQIACYGSCPNKPVVSLKLINLLLDDSSSIPYSFWFKPEGVTRTLSVVLYSGRCPDKYPAKLTAADYEHEYGIVLEPEYRDQVKNIQMKKAFRY